MANTIFSKLEKKLKKFDVQQMHSNGELASEFMVMSGKPNKNGIAKIIISSFIYKVLNVAIHSICFIMHSF